MEITSRRTRMNQLPSWLREFVERATDEVATLNTTDEVHCHVYHNTDDGHGEWEISLFCGANTVGGRLQAFPLDPVLSVDVFALGALLDEPEGCRWQTRPMGIEDDLGAHLSIEGGYRGHRIWLRVLSERPSVIGDGDTSAADSIRSSDRRS
jgi:hypothetical protein